MSAANRDYAHTALFRRRVGDSTPRLLWLIETRPDSWVVERLSVENIDLPVQSEVLYQDEWIRLTY